MLAEAASVDLDATAESELSSSDATSAPKPTTCTGRMIEALFQAMICPSIRSVLPEDTGVDATVAKDALSAAVQTIPTPIMNSFTAEEFKCLPSVTVRGYCSLIITE